MGQLHKFHALLDKRTPLEIALIDALCGVRNAIDYDEPLSKQTKMTVKQALELAGE
jgi:hypothetical protein